MTLSKDELGMIAFEIVAYSGDARTKLLEAVKQAKNKNIDKCNQLIEEARECLNDAHKAQTNLISLEANGEASEIGFLTVHAQDHLMTTLLLQDIIDTLLDIYK